MAAEILPSFDQVAPPSVVRTTIVQVDPLLHVAVPMTNPFVAEVQSWLWAAKSGGTGGVAAGEAAAATIPAGITVRKAAIPIKNLRITIAPFLSVFPSSSRSSFLS